MGLGVPQCIVCIHAICRTTKLIYFTCVYHREGLTAIAVAVRVAAASVRYRGSARRGAATSRMAFALAVQFIKTDFYVTLISGWSSSVPLEYSVHCLAECLALSVLDAGSVQRCAGTAGRSI